MLHGSFKQRLGGNRMFIFNKDVEFDVIDANTKRKVLAHNGTMMAVEVHFDQPTQTYVPHNHVHEQITYVLKGKLEFYIDGEPRTVEAGDSIYFASDIPHGCIVLEEGSIVLDVFTPMREDFLK